MKTGFIVVSIGAGNHPVGIFGYPQYGLHQLSDAEAPLHPNTKVTEDNVEDFWAAVSEALGSGNANRLRKKVEDHNEKAPPDDLSAPRIFNRKGARAVAAHLNEWAKPYEWKVVQIGDPVKRSQRPVLGWRVVSKYNDARIPLSMHDSGTIRLSSGEYVFAIRALARSSQFIAASVEPVYTAWRADYDGGRGRGSIRFRTLADCKKWIADIAPSCVPVMHDEEVPESHLYRP